MNSILQKAFGNEKRWVSWRYKDIINEDGTPGKTKVPMRKNGIRKASSINPLTWSTYAEIPFEKKGIMFMPNKLLLGIDLDHFITNGSLTSDFILDFIQQCDSYTELSPSATGVHIFLILSDPLTLEANNKRLVDETGHKTGYECYTEKRYFTVTEKPFGQEKDVRTVSSVEALRLLSLLGYPWKDLTASPLQKMFSSEYGDSIKKLYDGDISFYDNDTSRADMALVHHLCFWTNGNAGEIEKLWLASPLGQREKTQKRKDYRERTIKNVLKDFVPSLDLLFTMKGKTKIFTLNTENICRIIKSDPQFKGRFRYDCFKNMFEILPINSSVWKEFDGVHDAITIQTRISVCYPYFQRVGKDMVYDALMRTFKDNAYDSASDFLTSLKWDAIPRLDVWLSKTYGTPDDMYHKAVGSNWMKGLVKRIIEPGCKFDYVIALVGDQGTKKSTSLSVLGGTWHVETTANTDNKDFFMQFSGKAIIEFSEGETPTHTDVKRMKAIITTQSDKYRPPYERTSREFPRRCVFAMTTNEEEFLKDTTGNRRWFPVQVVLPEANIEWLSHNRNQLFAEAYHRVITLKETTYEFPKEESLSAQNARTVHDPNNDLIVNWYYGILTSSQRDEGITIYQVYREVLNEKSFSIKPLNKYDEMCIANVLKRSLRLTRRRTMQEGDRLWRWFDDEHLADTYAPITPKIPAEWSL